MQQRGWFIVVLDRPKALVNAGGVLRSARLFGASGLWVVGYSDVDGNFKTDPSKGGRDA